MKNQPAKSEHKTLRCGFTLVEMLVAVSIFSVVVTIAADIFIRAQRAQRQAAALEKVQDVTRFIMTRMAQELSTGRIAYECYAGTEGSCNISTRSIVEVGRIVSDTLAVQGADGQITQFTRREGGNADYGFICGSGDITASCLIMIVPDRTPERVTPDGYTIQKLAFFITPGEDPLTVAMTGDPPLNDYPIDAQPKVTVLMTVRGAVPGIRDPIDLSVQTTLSSRQYTR